jgi:hypothetical protein
MFWGDQSRRTTIVQDRRQPSSHDLLAQRDGHTPGHQGPETGDDVLRRIFQKDRNPLPAGQSGIPKLPCERLGLPQEIPVRNAPLPLDEGDLSGSQLR